MKLLATNDDLAANGHDVGKASPMLYRASARVRRYLARRSSAAALFADDATVPDALSECVCAIASRMAATSEQVSMGVHSETAGAQTVTYGKDAYGGLSGLLDSEKSCLDELYPRLGGRTADSVMETA